ncbi:MAG: hypothetical protein VST72_03745 [Nitrospirota bacterium]|nr:hypothetical protein [Nitrospirota bacterium]
MKRARNKLFLIQAACLVFLLMPAESSFPLFFIRGAAAAEAEAGPRNQPEISGPVSNVDLKDNLLSVDLVNADFRGIMDLIEQKAGTKIRIDGDVSGGRLTTRFYNLELDRGISRLLAQARENNYIIHYNAKGIVDKVEVYDISPASPEISGRRGLAASRPRRARYRPPSARSAGINNTQRPGRRPVSNRRPQQADRAQSRMNMMNDLKIPPGMSLGEVPGYGRP